MEQIKDFLNSVTTIEIVDILIAIRNYFVF